MLKSAYIAHAVLKIQTIKTIWLSWQPCSSTLLTLLIAQSEFKLEERRFGTVNCLCATIADFLPPSSTWFPIDKHHQHDFHDFALLLPGMALKIVSAPPSQTFCPPHQHDFQLINIIRWMRWIALAKQRYSMRSPIVRWSILYFWMPFGNN